MPFIKGNKAVWNLGNIGQSSRIYNFNKRFNLNTPNQPDTYCGPCGDSSQPDLHTAKALVLCCMDFRLRDNTTCQLNLKGYKNQYDEVIAAGASLGYNGLADYSG